MLLPPLLAASGCLLFMIDMPGRSHTGPLALLSRGQVETRARLQTDLAILCQEIGERNDLRYEALQRTAGFIEDRLRSLGLEPRRRQVEADGRPFHNLEVVLEGTPLRDAIVVGAHYDSVAGSPGADDNASGVAVTLELARLLRSGSFRHPIRLAFFVNEEPPFFKTPAMGSLEYARQLVDEKVEVAAMLSIEALGYFSGESGSQQYPFPFGLFYPNTGNFVAFVGNPFSRTLVRRAVKAFRSSVEFPSEGAVAPSLVPGVSWSDHWSFWQQGFQAIVVSGTAPFRNPNYHEPTDRLETLDPDAMARITHGLVGVVRQLDEELE